MTSTEQEWQEFRVFGRAHPERRLFWFDPMTLTLSDDEGPAMSLAAEMRSSQFSATFGMRGVGDIQMARWELEDLVATMTDTIGFLAGEVATAELVRMELPTGEMIDVDVSLGRVGTWEGLPPLSLSS